MVPWIKFLFCISLGLLISLKSLGQEKKMLLPGTAIYIPDPFLCKDGSVVKSKKEWFQKRRPELLRLFEDQVYGRDPAKSFNLQFRVFDVDSRALGGRATRKQVALLFNKGKKSLRIDLLLYLPNQLKGPVPVFLGLNFAGNQTISPDTAIRITSGWEYAGNKGVINHQATVLSRGTATERWPLKMIIDSGYGVVTMYAGDIAPDKKEGYTMGIPSLYPELQKGNKNFATLSAWAWGLSRAMDYFETDKRIDAGKVVVFGWSRMGKAAL